MLEIFVASAFPAWRRIARIPATHKKISSKPLINNKTVPGNRRITAGANRRKAGSVGMGRSSSTTGDPGTPDHVCSRFVRSRDPSCLVVGAKRKFRSGLRLDRFAPFSIVPKDRAPPAGRRPDRPGIPYSFEPRSAAPSSSQCPQLVVPAKSISRRQRCARTINPAASRAISGCVRPASPACRRMSATWSSAQTSDGRPRDIAGR